jgi:hypothetical protein
MARYATLLVADELYYNLNGKAILQGIYHSDLILNSEQATIPQLIFFFIAETDIADPFRSASVEVTLPENDTIRQQVPISSPITLQAPPGRTKFFLRWPLLVSNPTLRPGRIGAKLIHEAGEMEVSAPWIVFVPISEGQKATPLR